MNDEPFSTLAHARSPENVADAPTVLPPAEPGATGPHNPPHEAPLTANKSLAISGYEILGELGRGGMGVVYKARHLGLNRLVALKMILAGSHAGADLVARFKAEAEAVAKLQHANIVQIFDIGEHEGKPFFSLEFVEGGSLDRRLKGTPLPPRQAAELVETLAKAMHAAHQKGIIHRDLKPANVLVGTDCTLKIMDFGLAKELERDSGHTKSGAIMGTPSYMAPEQAEGKRAVGPPADIYALGAILYECLTGRPPFLAATPLDTILQVVSEEPVPPRQLQPKTPRDLETICLKCLQKEPARRYETACGLADDLRRFLKGEPITARPVRRVERGWRWCRRNKVVTGLLAAVVLTLTTGTVVSTYLAVQSRAEKRLSDRRYYASVVQLAYRDWQGGRTNLVVERLLAQTPHAAAEDLRGFEWYYLKRLCHLELRTLAGHTGAVNGVAWSPDGRQIASASGDAMGGNAVKVWNAATGEEYRTLLGHAHPVQCVGYNPDGSRLVAAGSDGNVRVWNAATGELIATLTGHKSFIQGLALSADGRLATASDDHTVKVWSMATGQELRTLSGHAGWVASVAFSPDGRRLASASYDHTIKLWDAATYQELRALNGHTGPVHGVVFSPDGRRLATAGDNTVRVWDVATGQPVYNFRGHTDAVRGLAYSSDGRLLASASDDQTIKMWDVAGGQEIRTIRGHTNRVTNLAFSPDGRCLASASNDQTVKVWDTTDSEEFVVVREVEVAGAIQGGEYSPDGRRRATAGAGTSLFVRDIVSGHEVFNLRGHTEPVSHVAFSPDGRRLASTSGGLGGDQTVKVWDAVTGQELITLRGRRGRITGVGFTRDGRGLALATYDQTVSLWDGSELTQEMLAHREARGLLKYLFAKPLAKSDVLAAVRADQTITEAVRQKALELSASYRDRPEQLGADSRTVVAKSGLDILQYQCALKQAELACRLLADNADYRTTLGVAQYRVGQFAEALAVLTKADQLHQGSHPSDAAFLAMTHAKLGHKDQAQAEFERLRTLAKKQEWAENPEVQAWLREAEETLKK